MKHWHHNKNWKPGCKEPGYFACEIKDCKKPIAEVRGVSERLKKLLRCDVCNKPYKTTSPHSWKGDCSHVPKNLEFASI